MERTDEQTDEQTDGEINPVPNQFLQVNFRPPFGSTMLVKKSARSYLLYLITSYALAERVEYTEDTFVSASSEIHAPGGSYFGYSVFPGVMLASSMHSPEPLFRTCNSFY
jgi:hypothetical protein